MNKSESKYFNTAIKFDQALLSLLEQKPFEYITVSELCVQAGVNRSTFYLHYENTSDLLRETANKLGYTRLGSNVLSSMNHGFAYAEAHGAITVSTNGMVIPAKNGT